MAVALGTCAPAPAFAGTSMATVTLTVFFTLATLFCVFAIWVEMMAGMPPIWPIVAAALFGFMAFWGFDNIANAQTPHDAGHAQHHDVYRHWMRPHQPATPCCNAKRTDNGEVTGDCYPVRAWIKDGQWWAMKDDGVAVQIPDDRIIRQPNPDPTGEAGQLCESYGLIHCFRPPNTGG